MANTGVSVTALSVFAADRDGVTYSLISSTSASFAISSAAGRVTILHVETARVSAIFDHLSLAS